ncbi:haloalkane dehalogenase [Kutzneria sp. CA-103260]|uniref:haloalkane dehalogenase n=1 Tax=Kutzneria sp. CA-103260 TaxID=2802641 RepID=UPI001BA9788D|nr:haloalkane dehalogenase [Kutzneria sp. CA-103260]QUQ68796.1 haloalkane dehalogenase [Kutzneria sp. CA-103260]
MALEKKYVDVNGYKMAYVERGEGDPIVFTHGNPTSSHLWRNILPSLEGYGRLIACDLLGMGDSDKVADSGPNSYSYLDHRDFLFAAWDKLGVTENVILVLHDWGSALGFDWAERNRDRVAGIAYMEAMVSALEWRDFDPQFRSIFQGFRSPAGEEMVLENNFFLENVMFGCTSLSAEDKAVYRAPFATPGESRRPTLSWPRQLPILGEGPDYTIEAMRRYGAWLAQSPLPKLLVRGDPGSLLIGPALDFARSWPNQTEVTVPGVHFLQEDSPVEVAAALVDFVKRVRNID